MKNCICKFLDVLEKIDIEAFERESENYRTFCDVMIHVNNEEEMNVVLKASMRKLGFELPWEGDFDEFMSNKDNKLVFS